MDQLRLDKKVLNAGRYVAVAVDRDKGSQNALRWAADNLLIKGQSVTLIHVNQEYLSCPSPARSMGSSSTRSTKSGSSDIDDLEQYDQSQDIFVPFRAYASCKDISCEAVIIDDYDIVKALLEYVKLFRIETLVLGAASKHGISRIFNKHDIPTAVVKGAPDFCNVFVVSKEKVNFAKAALRPLRSLSLTAAMLPVGLRYSFTGDNFKATTRATQKVPHGPGDKITNLSTYSSMNARERGRINEDIDLKHEVSSFHAKSMKNTLRTSSPGRWISPIYDNSKSQSTRKPSKSLSVNSLDLRSTLEEVKLGGNDKRESSDIKSVEQETTKKEIKKKQLTPEKTEELEEKTRLLELQMKQTMEMYHGACKEALKEKEKNKELQLLRNELADALMAKEEALALAEKEKEMRIAATETAKVAQTKLDEEARKRNAAEKELLELADETRMILHLIDDSQTIVNCEENTCRNPVDESEEDAVSVDD
ncbi:hypothetical protein Leryth_010396 [Lithospermum erythrorhizon]|nr:hypothetical protein Leryth_010396 [Lithospermum erythrorhizon]